MIDMARPREFEEQAVLAAAMQQFWRYGYEATSIRDLAENMGITGASLYNAFGDERSLYRRALEQYLDETFRERIGRFEEKLPPREALEAFFR
jgi:TetR/AcrR family transcriptional repressor of nem operon